MYCRIIICMLYYSINYFLKIIKKGGQFVLIMKNLKVIKKDGKTEDFHHYKIVNSIINAEPLQKKPKK